MKEQGRYYGKKIKQANYQMNNWKLNTRFDKIVYFTVMAILIILIILTICSK